MQTERNKLRVNVLERIRNDYLQYAEWYDAQNGEILSSSPNGLTEQLKEDQRVILRCRQSIRGVFESLLRQLRESENLCSGMTGYLNIDEFIEESYDDCKARIRKSFGFVEQELKRPLTTIDGVNEKKKAAQISWLAKNRQLAAYADDGRYPDLPSAEMIADFCFVHWDVTDRDAFFSADEMRRLCEQYRALSQQMDAVQAQIDADYADAVRRYWDEHAAALFSRNPGDVLFSEGSCRLVRDNLREVIRQDEAIRKYQEIAEKQKKIFREYLDNYTADLSEARKKAIYEQGWRG